jgi:hypothetical protein
MDMNAAGIRAARALLFTTLCVTLSASAHVLLSGTPLPLTTLFAVAAAVYLLAFALADRERGYAHIASTLIPLELAADTVFTTGQQACYGQAGGPITGPLRSLGVDLVCGGGSLGTSLTGTSAPQGGQGAVAGPSSVPGALSWLSGDPQAVPWLLLAAHIAVGLVAAAWLRRGEAAFAALLRVASVTAFRPLRLALAACHCPYDDAVSVSAPRALSLSRPPALPLLTHSVHRRGPPAYALAA